MICRKIPSQISVLSIHVYITIHGPSSRGFSQNCVAEPRSSTLAFGAVAVDWDLASQLHRIVRRLRARGGIRPRRHTVLYSCFDKPKYILVGNVRVAVPGVMIIPFRGPSARRGDTMDPESRCQQRPISWQRTAFPIIEWRFGTLLSGACVRQYGEHLFHSLIVHYWLCLPYSKSDVLTPSVDGKAKSLAKPCF